MSGSACVGDDNCVSFNCKADAEHRSDTTCQTAGCGNTINWYADCQNVKSCNDPSHGDRCKEQGACLDGFSQAAWCNDKNWLCVKYDKDLAAKGEVPVGGNCTESFHCAQGVCLEGFCRRNDKKCNNPEDCDSWVCDKGTCLEFTKAELDEMYADKTTYNATDRQYFKLALLQRGLPESSFRIDQWPVSFEQDEATLSQDLWRLPSEPCKRSSNLTGSDPQVVWPKSELRFVP